MGSDRARVSYDPHQLYRSVVMQQGRVTLEADWNEAQQIASEEVRSEALDFVGPSGTPDDGYKVTLVKGLHIPRYDFFVTQGTMYVGGVRAVLPLPVQYSNQHDWLDSIGDPDWVDLSSLIERTPIDEFIYLLLREQEVSAVEDPDLKDVALGGPDTAQRTRLLQHIVRLASPGTDCATGLTAAEKKWKAEGLRFDPRNMRLLSWGQLQVGFSDLTSSGPCEPQAVGGYVAPDNQLIRVQLSGTDPAAPKFLWGFDDASFLYRIDIDPNNPQNLILQSAPVDNFHQPVAGQAVEILRAAAELPNGAFVAAPSGFVVTLDQNYQPGTQSITLPSGVFLPPEYLGANQSPPAPLFLRVWQQEKIFRRGAATPLGDTGLLVTIDTVVNEPFHLGDFWLFAVRPATPRQVYPERYQNGFQFPDGPREWACPLGVIGWRKESGALVSDCRNPFDNLVDLSKRWQGCCTITVRPQDLTLTNTLQSIVDKAANPTAFVQAVTPGSAGNNIAISVHNLNINSNPPVFDVTVTETDIYAGLTPNTIEGILGGSAAAGTKPGLAHVLSGSLRGSPQNQTVSFSGGAAGSAQADFADSSGQLAFTLQAKSAGADGNLTTATISVGLLGSSTFDLTLVWTKTLKGLNLGNFLQRMNSDLGYEIQASGPVATTKSSFPAEDIVLLAGGVDGAVGTTSTSTAANAYLFGSPKTICLRPGSYLLPAPLVIRRLQSNLTIEGCGGPVTISADPKGEINTVTELIQVLGARNVTLRGLTLVMSDNSFFNSGFLLGNLNTTALNSLRETALARLRLSIGIRLVDCEGVTIEDCNFRYPEVIQFDSTHFFAGIYSNGDCVEIQVGNNRFLGPANLSAASQSGSGVVLVYGYIQAPNSSFNSLNADASAFKATVALSTVDDLTFDGNRFQNLTFPVNLQVPVGVLKFVSNRVESCLTGLTITEASYYGFYTRASGNFPDAALQQTVSRFFSSALIQNSIAVPAAIPLPAGYQPARTMVLTKTAAAPTAPITAPDAPATSIGPGITAGTTGVPLVKLTDLQPFASRIIQLASQTPGISAISIGPGRAALTVRVHIASNAMDILPGLNGYAILVGSAFARDQPSFPGVIAMTGNTLLTRSALPSVLFDGVADSAVSGNVVMNGALSNQVLASYSLVIFPEGTVCAATGNICRGQVFFPARPGATPPLSPWATYNDVR